MKLSVRLSSPSEISSVASCLSLSYGLASHRGSISAEHGIGKMKPQHLHYSKDAVSIDLMKKIKQLFDERGIMNPGKVVPM